jgi:peptidoglycan/LPS O-acetylase OafA/YrhL
MLRGAACLGVILFHLYGAVFAADSLPWNGWVAGLGHHPFAFYLLYPLHFGSAGVTLFFVISGFCIRWSHIQSRSWAWPMFYWRRFWRIYPPYFAALMLWVQFRNWQGVNITSTDLWTHVFLVNNVREDTFFGHINGVFWTLATEAQLYLAYPLVAVVFRRLGSGIGTTLFVAGSIACIAAGFAFLHLTEHGPSLLWNAVPMVWGDWVLGAYVADRLHAGRNALRLSSSSLLAVSAVGLIAGFSQPTLVFQHAIFAVIFAIILDRALRTPVPRCLDRLCAFGRVSYSAYMLHQPLMPGFVRMLVAVGASGASLGMLAAPILVYAVWVLSLALFWQIERASVAIGKALLPSPARNSAPAVVR